MPTLTRVEATARAAVISVETYQLDLDVTGGGERFRSHVTIRFRATPGSRTFVECKPEKVRSVRLNSTDLDPATLVDNRLPLAGLTERNTLTAEADMAYTNTGRGCTESSTRSTGKSTCTPCRSPTRPSASSPRSTSPTSGPRSPSR